MHGYGLLYLLPKVARNNIGRLSLSRALRVSKDYTTKEDNCLKHQDHFKFIEYLDTRDIFVMAFFKKLKNMGRTFTVP